MRWKRIAGVFLVLVTISLIAVYVIISSYDFNRLKPLIEKTVLDSTGRELSLRGDIRVRFGLSPSLVIEDVRFQNPLWGMRPDMARIRSLRIHVALIPLIFGNVRVKQLVIVEPDISIETDRSGRSNLEFERPNNGPASKPSGESESSRFSLEHITLEKGLLAYRDGRSDKSYVVNLERLDVYTSGASREFKAKGTYNGIPFEISWRLSIPSPDTYRISDLRASLEKSDLSGNIEITAGKRPGLKADFRSGRIDLRFFNKAPQTKTTTEDAEKRKRIFSDEPLPLDLLEKADAEIKFSGGKILLWGILLNDLSVEITLKDGRLSLKGLKAETGGATLNGRVDFDSRQRALSAALSAHGIDAAIMLKELGGEDTLHGKFDVDIQAEGRGRSVAEIMGSLDGHLSVVMGKGSIDNKYLGLIGKGLREGIMRLINPSSRTSDRTGINCFVCRIKAEHGLSNIEALVLDTDLMSVIGSGHIDLKTERLNASLTPAPKTALGIGRYSISLGELVKPFRLGGTLADPSLAIDPTQTAITVGKALGGIALFGPAGIAAALAGQKEGVENPCLSAIESEKARKPPEKKKDDLSKSIEDIEKGIRKLFGR